MDQVGDHAASPYNELDWVRHPHLKMWPPVSEPSPISAVCPNGDPKSGKICNRNFRITPLANDDSSGGTFWHEQANVQSKDKSRSNNNGHVYNVVCLYVGSRNLVQKFWDLFMWFLPMEFTTAIKKRGCPFFWSTCWPDFLQLFCQKSGAK